MARSDPPGGKPRLKISIEPIADGKPGRMAPPGNGMGAPSGGKETPTPDDITRSNEHCIDCENYNPQDGSCAKWDGSFDPQDACKKYFSALSDQDQEPDADDQGGPSDQDADDQAGGGQ